MLPIQKVFLRESPISDCFDVYVRTPGLGKVNALGPLPPLVIHTLAEGDTNPVAFCLDRESALALIDGLWEAGIRPTALLKPGPIVPHTDDGVIDVMTREIAGLRMQLADANDRLAKAQHEHIADLRVAAGIAKPADRPASGERTF